LGTSGEVGGLAGNRWAYPAETNAAKRLLHKIRTVHPKLPLIILGDGLYSK